MVQEEVRHFDAVHVLCFFCAREFVLGIRSTRALMSLLFPSLLSLNFSAVPIS